MRNRCLGLILLSGFLIHISSCGNKSAVTNPTSNSNEKDTCDDPDANINCCFRNIPDNITGVAKISPPNEPGSKLIVSGIVYKSDGTTPYPDVLIYAYHTDNNGLYSKKGNETGVQKWHGHLHGWCKTNEKGEYTIKTIRPARYPDNTSPAHIHAAIREPDGTVYYVNDFVFKDDSLVNEAYLSSLNLTGGNGVLEVRKDQEGNGYAVRNMVLERK